MISIPKTIQIIAIIIISLYLLILVGINLFKTEYDDPPYNYLSNNWLNSPIKDIEIIEPSSPNSNIKKYDNQHNIGFFKSDSKEQDLNIFYGSYFKIILYTPYYYPNFFGYNKKYKKNSDNYKVCGQDSQNNILYFPRNEDCPINFIRISEDNNICENLKINCKYQKLKNNKYLVTSNENIDGQIITQLRINYNNKICADSSVDLTFNDLLEDYKNYECKEEYGYDKIYNLVGEGEENIDNFLDENNLNNLKIKNNDKIFLSYRGYLGVDNIDNFEEHPIDHVTYAKKIALSKNIILFISCFYYIFCSIFIFYYSNNNKFFRTINVIAIIYLVFFIFNFCYDFHVMFTFFRVKGIVSTINLDGLYKYKTGLRWFIIIDIFILFGIVFDFVIKLLQYLMFRLNLKKK